MHSKPLHTLLLALGWLFVAAAAQAQVVTYTWIATGDGTNTDFNNTANWQGGLVPPSSNLSKWSFPAGNDTVQFSGGAISLHSIYLDSNYPGAFYSFTAAAPTTLTVAPDNFVGQTSPNIGNSRGLSFDANITLNFATDQTWTASNITFNGAAGGSGRFRYMPHSYFGNYSWNTGHLELNGPGNFTGGLETTNVYITVGHASALAGGPLFFTDTTILSELGTLTLNNAITTAAGIGSGAEQLNLTGPVTLGSGTTFSGNIRITGNIGETFSSTTLGLTSGTLRLAGANSYTGGSVVATNSAYAPAVLLFENATALPATGSISSDERGYVGIAFTSGVQNVFIDRLSQANFQGTLGFDSLGATQTFTESINLGYLDSHLGIGSSTSAILTGSIGTSGEGFDNYRFGNGGGTLTVASSLAGSKGVDVVTAGFLTPTTIVLQGNNTFTGDLNVISGLVIVDSATALPGGALINLDQGSAFNQWDFAYAGFTEASGLTPATFLAHFNPLADQVVLGVDSSNPAAPRTLADNIDLTSTLSDFNGETFFVGTATGATLTGTLTSGAHRLGLTGFKGAQLVVNSGFTDATIGGLTIGLVDVTEGIAGSVRLNGASTFSGGTIWQSGELVLGHSAALGNSTLLIDFTNEPSPLTYVGDLTLANSIRFLGSDDVLLGRADSPANLTLTGNIISQGLDGFDYLGAGILTYAGTNPALGALAINAAPGGGVVYNRAGGEATRVGLVSGSLTISANTSIKLLETAAASSVQISAGATLKLIDNTYSEGPAPHHILGNLAGAGALAVVDNYAALTGSNSYAGGTTLDNAYVGFTQAGALGTGSITVQSGGSELTALAPDLSLANAITLGGELGLQGATGFGYESYNTPGNRNLTLSGIISGSGSLVKDSDNTVTLTGANTFTGGIELEEGTLVLAHDLAAGTGLLAIGGGATANFTTAAPVVGGLEADDYYLSALVQLAPNSTLTVNQQRDALFFGGISGTNARLSKGGTGYLTFTGGNYTYGGGTDITAGGMIFDHASAVSTHGAGGISVAAGAYAGLGANAGTAWADFSARINPASAGTLGVDGYLAVSSPIDLSGFSPGVRLGSASFGTVEATATITPNGDYRFGGGGGTLLVKSTLTDALKSVDVTSPASQPLTLWLQNNNYFGGPLSATHSAVIFGIHAADYVSALQLGTGGYIGSAEVQLAPTDFLAKLQPGTSTGIIGFDDLSGYGRAIGGAIDLSAFGSGLSLGTATTTTIRGPLTLPGGSPAYRFAGYKTGALTVASDLDGSQGVIIGDADVLGTMRDVHNPSQRASVTLTGLNTYSGGTVLNAGNLYAGPKSLGTGTLTVQPNSLPATTEPLDNLPRFEPLGAGGTFTNNILLNGSLALGGIAETTLAGTISGPGALHINRFDYLPVTLTAANTYTGGTVFHAGNVALGHDTALGTGTVAVYQGGLLTAGGARTLGNAISVLQDENNSPRLRVGGEFNLTLNGPVAFDPGTGYVSSVGSPFSPVPLLRFNGGLSGDAKLEFDTGGKVWIAGTNTYTGGTESASSQVIFDSVSSLPAVGTLGNFTGYIGLATPTASLQASFIDRFSGSYYNQVIGFDSPNVAAPQTFAANIDLSALNYAYLGSATAAILSGSITPYDDIYLFAGTGGGVLTVTSALTGNRNVRLEYNEAPFLVRLGGANSYTGTTQANGLGLIFATAAALPAGQHFQFNNSIGSYFGYEDPGISVASFLSHFNPGAPSAIVGFDSVDVNAPRTITSPDLSVLTGSGVYIGTATRANIDGTITLAGGNQAYKFGAYRTGWLTVNSVFSGLDTLNIGAPMQWSLREVDGAFPTVELAGNNTHSGTTSFLGGQLVVSQASALGTGTLNVVNPDYNHAESVHRLLLNTPTVANPISLTNSDIELRLATTLGTAALTGNISGQGTLVKDGANALVLTGTNSFVGDVVVEQGWLELASATAFGGSTDNRLLFREAGGTAHFSAGNPVIGALLSEPGISATVQIDAGVNLMIGAHNSGFSYQTNNYYGAITGAGSLTKDGHSVVALHGASSYTGGTTITQGVLLADNVSALGTGAITLNGGELVFGPGITISNPISFGASGGLLSGASTFTGPVLLGAQAGLSPGQSPGTMTFASDLTLAGASFLDFEIQDPTGLAGAGYDTLVVGGTLFVTATPGTPFVINIKSLDGSGNPGQLQISDPNASYSLQVVSAGLVSGFAAANFTLNTANFSTNWGNDFSFSLVQSGNQLLLNFSPVPEPSTYALLGLGGLLAGLARWRRRFTGRN